MANDMWSLLGIETTQDKKAIRRAFAEQSRIHHPEEEPELFAKLNEAYKDALEYAKNGEMKRSSLVTENEEVLEHSETEQNKKGNLKRTSLMEQLMDAETAQEDTEVENISVSEEADSEETSLLELMEKAENEKIQKSLQSGALRSFLELFENPNKVKSQEAWKKYFLSDEFLAEQFCEEFGKGMLGYIESQRLYPVNNLPVSLLVELVIAYGFEPYIAYSEYRQEEQCYVNIYRVNAEGSAPARQYVAQIWNKQGENCGFTKIMDLLRKPESRCRYVSVMDYLKLKSMNQKDALTIDNRKAWDRILYNGRIENMYEHSKFSGSREYESRSTCFIKLIMQWLKDETVPQVVLEYMYKEYQLKHLEYNSAKTLYAPLKEEIDKQITEEEQESIEDRQEMIKTWYNAYYKVANHYYNVEADRCGETEEIKEQVLKLFEMPEWDKIKYEPEFFEKLKFAYGGDRTPLTMAEKLIELFSSEKYPKTEAVQKAIERLYTSISFAYMLQEKNPNRPADHPFYRNRIEDIDETNLYFWQYFFLYAYGYRSAVMVSQQRQEPDYALGSTCYLPAYVRYMYRITGEWQKVFTGFDEEEKGIRHPVSISYQMEDGRILRMEFHLHYILFFLDEVQVLKPQLTFKQLVKYQESLEKPEHFFFLLAITAIGDRTRTEAEKLIARWLEKLPFYPIMRPMLAKMLAADNDRLPGKGQICAVYYEEQKRFCFRMIVSEQEVLLQRQINYQNSDRDFLQKDFGWKKLPLSEKEHEQLQQLDIEGKKSYAQQKLQTLRQPKPVVDKHYSFEGMSWDEKSEKILEVLEEPEGYCVLHYENQWVGKLDRIFYFAKHPFGINLHFFSQNCFDMLQYKKNKLQRKAKQRSEVVGYFGWGREGFSPDAIILGENGTYYADFNSGIKTLREKTVLDIFRKQYESAMKDAVSMTTYKGLLTVSRLDHELEYCYTENDLAESIYSEEQTVADFFTVFGKYPTWMEFAKWLDKALENGLSEETKAVRFYFEELNTRDCVVTLQILNRDRLFAREEEINDTASKPRFVWKNMVLADNAETEMKEALIWYRENGKFADCLREDVQVLFLNKKNDYDLTYEDWEEENDEEDYEEE